MSATHSPRREQILEEIERLKRELASRQAGSRPTPSSVLRAYQTLLTHHYERLDEPSGEDAGTKPRSINIP